MHKTLTTVAISLLGMATTSAAILPTPSFATATSLENQLSTISKIQETATKEVVPEEKPKVKRLTCKGCNSNESYVLNALQDQGILDKVAVATIMANIKQESQFEPRACESAGKVPYHQCKSGGVGIIQWTNAPRYNGLGLFAKKYGGDPSSIETQLKYMFYEEDWKIIENGLKTPGKTITDYMRLAEKWLRWGIKGPREQYAKMYIGKLYYDES